MREHAWRHERVDSSSALQCLQGREDKVKFYKRIISIIAEVFS